MAAQYYAVVPITRENRDAAQKPLENAVALIHMHPAQGLHSFRPAFGEWRPSGKGDAYTAIGYGDDTAVKVTNDQAAEILQRLDPAASLLTTMAPACDARKGELWQEMADNAARLTMPPGADSISLEP